MQGIPSQAILGDVTVGTGEAPRHTVEGHEKCAYYSMVGPEGDDGDMICPHDMVATGAFYSEDYVRQLITTGQWIVSNITSLVTLKDLVDDM